MKSLSRAAASAFLLIAALSPAWAARHVIVIYHTSDVHGQMKSRPAKWVKASPERLVGGYAVLSNVLKKETTPYLLLDSGDIFQGTPEGNLTRGDASVAAMNALGYQAMAIGNHEYDYKEDNLRRLQSEAKFPFLGANIYKRDDGQRVDYAQPTASFTVGGVKVGVVGLATRHTKTSTLPANVKHLRFADEASEAKTWAESLRKDGAQVVVALTHCGAAESVATQRVDTKDYSPTDRDINYHGDIDIARGAPVDLVLGGHLHEGFEHPWKDPQSGVSIVESSYGLALASRVELVYDDEAKKIVSLEGHLVDLWADQYGEDPRIVDLLKTYSDKVGKELDVPVGEAAGDLLRNDTGLDSTIGNWMSDVMREAATADIGVQNTFGIRSDIRKGPVTQRNLYEVMPFDNTLVVVRMNGVQVERLVRDNLFGPKTGMQLSGLHVSYKLNDKDKVSWLEITHEAKPLQDDRVYTVATNNYLTGGGSGAGAMKDADKQDTGRSIRDIIIEAFKKKSPIQPPATGRFNLVN